MTSFPIASKFDVRKLAFALITERHPEANRRNRRKAASIAARAMRRTHRATVDVLDGRNGFETHAEGDAPGRV